MEQSIKQGFDSFVNLSGESIGSFTADSYVENIKEAINILDNDMNAFQGFKTPSPQLKGDIAEFWHSDTFNINAKLTDSSFKTVVDRSHGYASADITSNWGDKFGLKYLRNGTESAKAQSVSYFERYCKYKSISGRGDLSVHDYMAERGIDNDNVLNDPIYKGQIRIIPSDQIKEGTDYLENKIAKESMMRPEQVERYKDTLENVAPKIKAPDGTSSSELIAKKAEQVADDAKKGSFDGKNYGYSTEELIKIGHIVKQGLKAGTTAAVITMVLKTAPQIYKCIEELISSGKINEEQFRKLGFAALSGSSEGFIRGFVSASLVTSCKSGVFGKALKTVSPSNIAVLTVIFFSTMKDSFMVAKGVMTKFELVNNLSRNIFVSSCALGFGVLSQILLPALPGAYLLGNFVGTFIGSFAYIAWDKVFISFCVQSGFTLFGIVDQDYTLPDSVLYEIGINVFEYEHFFIDEYNIDSFDIDEYKCEFISIVRRGVLGVHQIGYTQ